MIKLSRCHTDNDEINAVTEAISSAYLGMGPKTCAFEAELQAFLKTEKEVVCVNSGSAALHLSIACLDIGTGDEVLVPTTTFAACFQAISATGAKPIPCDIKEDTLSLDLNSAKQFLTKKTRAIMPVHYASHADSLPDIYNFAKENNLRVIEDAAHALGTSYNNKLVGSTGDIICFSFDGIKNITSGEGGAIVTGDQQLLARLRDARLLGIEKDSQQRKIGKRSWDFDISHQGFRYHMSDINASIGRAQLKKIHLFKKKRQEIVSHYRNKLLKVNEIVPLSLDYDNIMPHIFVVRVLNGHRDALKNYLMEKGIESGIHYKPNHLLTRYKTEYKLPCAEKMYQEVLTLPLHVGLQQDELETVISSIKGYFKHD